MDLRNDKRQKTQGATGLFFERSRGEAQEAERERDRIAPGDAMNPKARPTRIE